MFFGLFKLVTEGAPLLIKFVEAIIAYFKDFVNVVKNLITLSGHIDGLMFFLPSEVIFIISLIFTFAFVYKIIGREG